MHAYLIKNCTIVDGTGHDSYRANLAISNGIISYIGTEAPEAEHVIDGTGKIVTPGFIDIH